MILFADWDDGVFLCGYVVANLAQVNTKIISADLKITSTFNHLDNTVQSAYSTFLIVSSRFDLVSVSKDIQ